MFEFVLLIIIVIILILGYYSTEPTKLNSYKENAENRQQWERAGYFYNWAPNLKSLENPDIDFRSEPVEFAPPPPPKNTPTPIPTPTPTPCPCTPSPKSPPPGMMMTPCVCPTPTPSPKQTPPPQPQKINDCQGFLKEIGGLDGIVGCRNVLHAKCRDNNPNYKPINAAEQKCVDVLARYSGNICNCMTPIHQVCQ